MDDNYIIIIIDFKLKYESTHTWLVGYIRWLSQPLRTDNLVETDTPFLAWGQLPHGQQRVLIWDVLLVRNATTNQR